MFKKILIIFGVFLVGGLFALWLIGGKNLKTSVEVLNLLALATKNSAVSAKQPVIDQNKDGIPDWEEEYRSTDPANESALALVRQAQAEKQEPLVSVDHFTGQGAKTYQLSDLNLINQEEIEFLKAYGQGLMQIMAKFQNPGIGYELPLTLEVAETGTDNTIKIIEATTRYQTVIGELLALDTPQGAGQIHLNLINNLSKLGYNSFLMSQIESEPTLALAAANLHSSTLRQFLEVIANINLFFAGPTLSLENEARLNITLDI